MTWWQILYDDVIADVLLDDGDDDAARAETETTIDFLVRELRLEPGDRVFDQCAGTGRLSIPLAQRGFVVEAVEQAERYVERARARAGALPVRFVAADAFAHVASPPCRAAINWWTSFGYLPDDAGNLRMLARAFESVAPGGGFALDFLHVPQILRAFRAHEITRRGDLVLERDTSIDLARGLMHKTWRVGGATRTSTVRAYHPHELANLVRAAGFTDVRLFGSVRGDALDLDAPRCIVIARRP